MALRRTDVETVAVRLDWTSGPVPNVAVVPLAGANGSRPHVTDTRAVFA